jgi:hypothetical protein
MVMFWPFQQELNCIGASGSVLGKIRFDHTQKKHVFEPEEKIPRLSEAEEIRIAERLTGLDAGLFTIPLQDDD